MTGTFGLLGGGAALAAAVWIYRFSRVTRFIKSIAIAMALLAAFSAVGVIEISFNPAAAVELGGTLWDLGRRLLGLL